MALEEEFEEISDEDAENSYRWEAVKYIRNTIESLLHMSQGNLGLF